MTKTEFKALRKKRPRVSQTAWGVKIGLSRSMVHQIEKGIKPISLTVELACLAVDAGIEPLRSEEAA